MKDWIADKFEETLEVELNALLWKHIDLREDRGRTRPMDADLAKDLHDFALRAYTAGREEERERLRHLFCPCGCNAFIDDKDYQETHSATEFEAPTNNTKEEQD